MFISISVMQITGIVKEGHHQGSKIGFPTINIDADVDFDHGVYACKILIHNKWMKGALHYGSRPAFSDYKISLEVHIVDFEGDLYGEMVKIEVYNKLREIKKFDSLEALSKQISEDVDQVKNLDI